MKKRFVIEIEVPEDSGDLVWDEDETGLNALFDCVIKPLCEINLRKYVWALECDKKWKGGVERFVLKQNAVRDSLKVIFPKPQ